MTPSFLSACGLSGPLTLEITGPGRSASERRTFNQPFAIVGRNQIADLVLDDEQVSQRHAYLQVLGGRLFCVDLESRSGVHWEGGRATSGWVGEQRGIQIGSTQIRFITTEPCQSQESPAAWPADLSDPLSSRPSSHEQLPKLFLEIPNRDGEKSLRALRSLLVLTGSSSSCRIQLERPGVSRFHCALVRTPSGPWAVDLLGRGGISVNGQRVRDAPVNGDLRVARHRIRLRASAPAVSSESRRTPSRQGQMMTVKSPSISTRSLAQSNLSNPTVMMIDGRTEMVEPTLSQFISQFGWAQQQMLEQFQQVLLMMAQLFGEIQRDQVTQIHRELDELHRLGEQVAALQGGLAAQSSQAAAKSPPRRTPETVNTFSNMVSGDYTGALDRPNAQLNQSSAPVDTKWAARSPRRSEGGGMDCLSVHGHLTERIVGLQREQQGRWQRILRIMTGQA